jgi:PhzF family phenazine biosynthesis protein
VLAVFESEDEVRAMKPDFERLSKVNTFAVIATAPGKEADFVSRFFAPGAGIAEDPVTGSAHCTLIPYWAKRLGKKRLHALQVSPRGGELFCELRGERVAIAGRAVLYLEGTIEV